MLRRRDFIKAGLAAATTASLADVATAGLAHGATLAGGNSRRRELMDFDWKFQIAKEKLSARKTAQSSRAAAPAEAASAFDDAAWRTVQLPHDYIVEGHYDRKGIQNHGFLPLYSAWYRKRFDVPAGDGGKSLWLDFEGVYRDAHVYLNGKFLGRHRGGYTPFRFDISDAVVFGGSNILAVYVDPTKLEGWFYEGGGIYRHVWLNTADPLHVAPWGVYVVSKVHQPRTTPWADLTIETKIANQGSQRQTCTVRSSIYDSSQRLIASVSNDLTVLQGESATLIQTTHVPEALLWSLARPHLYTLVTHVLRDHEPIDSHLQRFGIRTLRYDANKGFFLNEEHVELKGTCNHQDFVGVGTGAPDSLWYWRVRKLKEIGCNAVRCSHNLMSPAYYDACDELGLLVMDENRRLSDSYNAKTLPGNPYENMWHIDEMILRDRNHPSIIMWSLCNEEYRVEDTLYGKQLFTAAMKSVHRYDRTRPITSAMTAYVKNTLIKGWNNPKNFKQLRGFEAVEDLQGCNYAPGFYDKFHATYPHARMFGSEISNTFSDRGVYATDIAAGHVSSYSDRMERAWPAIRDHRFMAGGFIWTGFDYRGEPVPCSWPSINSHFGAFDMCGFPKDVAMYYKAWWGNQPLVHIFPHWNWHGQEGKPLAVWCFGNCEYVELWVNGKSQGKQAMPPLKHLQWTVPYEAGHIEARGYTGGVITARHRIETTGKPASLWLMPDRQVLRADGQDTVPIAAAVVDAAGRIVPTANNKIHFHLTGAGVNAGVGNGDPACLEPNQADERSAFNGLCMVLARARQTGGLLRVRATADGLKPAEVELLVRSPREAPGVSPSSSV